MKSILNSKYRNIIFLGLIVYLITGFFSQGYFHPDEHFQILEFSNYKLGLSSASDLTWEFDSKIRSTIQPTIVYAFRKFLNILYINNPFVIIGLLRILSAFLAWFIISKIALLFEKDLKSEIAIKALYLFLFGLWFMPLLNVRFSSENYGSLTLLAALYLILTRNNDYSKNQSIYLIFAGFLLGLSFWFRFQMAFAIIGLGVWLLFIAKIKWRSTLLLLSGFSLSLILGTFIDSWFYEELTFTPYNYFTANIINDIAANWGVEPWYYYIIRLNLDTIPPIGLVLFILFIVGLFKKPKNILCFVLIPFVLAHMFVDHKEFRFLFPIVVPFLIIAIYGLDDLLKGKDLSKPIRISAKVIFGINAMALLAIMFTPVNNAIPYYKSVYQTAKNENYTLICEEKPFYELVGQKVNFYKSNNIDPLVVQDSSEIVDYLKANSPKKILILERNLSIQRTYANYKTQSSYCSFPEWITKLDFNGWVDRARIWRIRELSRIE